VLPLLKFDETQILIFALVLIRVSTFTVSWPIFSVYSVPNTLKILFSLCLAILLVPVIPINGLSGGELAQEIGWLAGKEALVGLSLGFMTRLFFFAVNIGGNLVAMSTGLANAHIFNPSMNTQTTTVEQFYATIATLLFLALNGHHYFLTGLAQSFTVIPLTMHGTNLALNSGMGSGMGHVAGTTMGSTVGSDCGLILQLVTEAGIKIAAPVIIAIFFTNVAMGIVGRAVPQINILVTSMNVNFLAGLVVMIVTIPALILQMDQQILEFTDMLFKFMKAF
jgi:flagellar biosynthetic protein FliR